MSKNYLKILFVFTILFIGINVKADKYTFDNITVNGTNQNTSCTFYVSNNSVSKCECNNISFQGKTAKPNCSKDKITLTGSGDGIKLSTMSFTMQNNWFTVNNATLTKSNDPDAIKGSCSKITTDNFKSYCKNTSNFQDAYDHCSSSDGLNSDSFNTYCNASLDTQGEGGGSSIDKIKEASDKKKNAQSNTGDYDANCSSIIDDDTKNLLNKILVTMSLIGVIVTVVLSSLDFTKAVAASNDDANKKSFARLRKRIILIFIFFLLPTLINFGIDIINNNFYRMNFNEETLEESSQGAQIKFGKLSDCGIGK